MTPAPIAWTARRRSIGIAVAASAFVVLFASSFALAPQSCEGGLEIYFWGGVAALAALIVLAFAARLGDSLLACTAWAAGLAVLGAATWVAGLFAANFRIVCRLF